MEIAFFGSSLLSAYWNGAATYYRGMLKALSERGHRIRFYEPDAFERQSHRDIEPPGWAQVVVYPNEKEALLRQLEEARHADLIVKASGIGVFDQLLEAAVLELRAPGKLVVFWDVDAPATLERVATSQEDPFRALIPQYDLVFTYGGGPPVVEAYSRLGAKRCVPIYNALDPATHYRMPRDRRFEGLLGFLGNRLPDREQRVEAFFLEAAKRRPERQFVLGGSGWETKPLPGNVRHVGHVYTRDHNAFNCTPQAVLNINRESMAKCGYSPATRVFEAAGAGACIFSDPWEGLEFFFEPGRELLVVENGEELAEQAAALTPRMARSIGEAAYGRALKQHTYRQRAEQFDRVLGGHS